MHPPRGRAFLLLALLGEGWTETRERGKVLSSKWVFFYENQQKKAWHNFLLSPWGRIILNSIRTAVDATGHIRTYCGPLPTAQSFDTRRSCLTYAYGCPSWHLTKHATPTSTRTYIRLSSSPLEEAACCPWPMCPQQMRRLAAVQYFLRCLDLSVALKQSTFICFICFTGFLCCFSPGIFDMLNVCWKSLFCLFEYEFKINKCPVYYEVHIHEPCTLPWYLLV